MGCGQTTSIRKDHENSSAFREKILDERKQDKILVLHGWSIRFYFRLDAVSERHSWNSVQLRNWRQSRRSERVQPCNAPGTDRTRSAPDFFSNPPETASCGHEGAAMAEGRVYAGRVRALSTRTVVWCTCRFAGTSPACVLCRRAPCRRARLYGGRSGYGSGCGGQCPKASASPLLHTSPHPAIVRSRQQGQQL